MRRFTSVKLDLSLTNSPVVSPASSALLSTLPDIDATASLRMVGTLWTFLGVLMRRYPALAVRFDANWPGDRCWRSAWRAGRISCHHGDRLASAGRDSGTVWQFTQSV